MEDKTDVFDGRSDVTGSEGRSGDPLDGIYTLTRRHEVHLRAVLGVSVGRHDVASA
jgi:hypothetical protein